MALVEGKRITGDGIWFWINMEDIDWNCWVHSSMVELSVEHKAVNLVRSILPENSKVPSPGGVSASRSANKVTVSWSAAPSAPELEYLIEAIICTNEGYNLEVAYNTTSISLTFTDATGYPMASFGTLRVANKLGYSSAVSIPWP